MNYVPHFDPNLITPAHADLLAEMLVYLLYAYQPAPGQTRVEHAELLRLARNLDDIHRHVLERSQVWVELEEKA